MTEPPRRARYVLVRALLTSVALVIAIAPGTVVLGGYLPDLPTVGRFGVYLTTNLPSVLLLAVVGMLPVVIALRLGGGRFTRVLAGLTGSIVVGATVAGAALWATAASNDLSYSPLRQLAGPTTWRKPDQRIVFATVEGIDLHADLYLPTRAPDQQRRPALVWVHGGAFIAGELGQRPWLYQAVTDAGFVVIDIEYRLAPPPRWHDAPADVLCALAWVGAHADDHSIDPNRVILAGDSAGGSLALVAGYAAGTGRLESSCAGTPVTPAGIVGVEPAADLEGIWRDGTIADGTDSTYPEALLGGSPVEFPDRLAAASASNYVRDDVPPTLIVAAANDHLVRFARVQTIVDLLESVGAPVMLIVVPFAEHGLDGSPASAGSQLLEGLLPRFIENPAAMGGADGSSG